MKNTYDFNDAVTAVDLKFFLLDEIDPYIVVLQNYKIGWNTNTAQVYTAWYHGTGQVLIGNLVTPKTDPGDYIIEQNADVRVTSDNLIHMFPGFHAQAGCEFHAYIVQENCSNNHAPEYADDYENEQENQYLEDSHNSNDETLPDNSGSISFQIIPNPNTGSFTLEILANQNAGFNVYIFDLTGKLVYENVVNEQRSTYEINLEKGIYIVRVTIDGKNSTRKLIIQ